MGGEGSKIYDQNELIQHIENEKIGSGDSDVKDIFVIALANNNVTNPINITGRFNEEVHGCNDVCFDPTQDGSAFVTNISNSLQTAANVAEENMFVTDFPRHNTICFRGAYVLPT